VSEGLSPDEAEAVTAEALRLNDRYVREVIERFNVCPFARGARISGRAIREVLLFDACDEEKAADAVERHERGPESVEIVQLILPRVKASARAFEDFVSRVRAARALRPGTAPFALAGFHPEFGLNLKNADTAVAFFRRAPDPMIQLVRLTAIDALTRDALTPAEMVERFLRGEEPPPPPINQRITRDNYALLQREGTEVIAAIYAAIAGDRRR
jgi:hypothetical protein